MTQLIRKIKQISILLLVISFAGCENDDDNNLPQIVAGFTYTVNSDTGTVTFINISENSRSYEWNFGDGNASTEINPINTYETGDYTVSLTANNAAGASETFEDIISILIPEVITIPIGFDNANIAYNATTFNGTSFEVVDNPDLSGTNTVASKVGAITNIGAAFEGFFFDLGADLDLITQKTLTMNFWSDTAVDVLVKLEEGTGDDTEMTASHGGTGWEELIFTFASSNKYSRFTLFVDGPGTTAGTFYIDDIKQVDTPVATGPTDAPAAPPARDATDVISIYGEAYGAEVGLANVDWDEGSNFAEETIAGNKLLKVDFNDFIGTQLNSVVDATEMTNFHIDFWILDEFAAGQIFNPKWSNHTGGAGETNAFEYTNPIGDTDAKKWISIDIPIADFTGDNTRADLTQLLFAVASTLDVVYVDNIYFYKTGGGSTTVPTDAPAAPPARNAADVISIYGEAYGAEVGLANVDWDEGSNFAEETIAGNKLLKVDFNDFLGTQLNSVVDATEMTDFHMDFWIVDDFAAGQIFNPKWSNHTGGAGETNAFEYTNPIGDTDAKKWISIDIPITDFTGDNTRADLTQFLLAVASTIDVVYVDNIYFYKTGGGASSGDYIYATSATVTIP